MRTQPELPVSQSGQPVSQSRQPASHPGQHASHRSPSLRPPSHARQHYAGDPLRSCVLEDGLNLLRFTTTDQKALNRYHNDVRAGVRTDHPWLPRLTLRGVVPALLLARAHAVPPELKLAPTPAGTRDLFLEGCVLRIIAGSNSLVDVLKPQNKP